LVSVDLRVARYIHLRSPPVVLSIVVIIPSVVAGTSGSRAEGGQLCFEFGGKTVFLPVPVRPFLFKITFNL
jgi:hypothetical protein